MKEELIMFKDILVVSSSRLRRQTLLPSRAAKLLSICLLVGLAVLLIVPHRAVLASLVGDTVNVQFVNAPAKSVVVGAGIELPNAGPTLGAAGNAPRWNIDLDGASIRIDFIDQIATYGQGSFFLFSNLDPQLGTCPGTISGVTVTTNKPASQFNVAGAVTFTANSVRVPIAPGGSNLDWAPGEFIEVRLSYQPVPGCSACVPPPSGMKLWLTFDETMGTVANDIAGFNNIGVYGAPSTRPAPTAGVVAGALSFDGADDYVEVAHAADIDMLGNCALDVADSFTIDAWIKTSSSASLQTVLDKRTHSGDTNQQTGYHLYLSNGRVGFQMASNDHTNFTAPGSPINDGQWHFIAVTVTRCRSAVGNIYVDGNLVHTFQPLITNLSNTANLLVGKRHSAFGNNFFAGQIDELEIFKRALSAAELNAIFSAGSAGKCKNNCEPRACDLPGFSLPAYYDSGALNVVNFTFGDFDGDGVNDLVAINRNSNVASLLTGNADGTFNTPPKTIITTGTTPQTAAAGDFNKDGKLDLAVGIQSTANAVILIGKGDGTFELTVSSFSVGGSPSSMVTLDFNDDNNLDLAVANNIGVRLLAGNGDGTFASGALLSALTNTQFVTKGDFNLDGRTDLVAANLSANQVSVFLANTSGGFNSAQNINVGAGSNNIAVGDIDLDGDLDLAVSSPFINVASILRGDGQGGFAPAINQNLANPSGAIALADFNGDGIPDLIVADANANALIVLKGKGDGTFSAGATVNLTGTSTQILVGDFNQDGKHDLAANVPAANDVAILLNNCTASVATITVTPASLNIGIIGQPLTQIFTASGGMGPYTFSLASGSLPKGVTLQPDGTLTGIPEETGTFTFTVKAIDKNGCMGTVTIQWRVDCPAITIAPTTLPAGTAGASYTPVQLVASGGTAAYTFAVTSGLLPMGVQLSSSGQLIGTPMQSGPFTFTVTVTDKFGCTGLRQYTLTINCQTLIIGPENTTLPDTTQNVAYNPQAAPTFTATGGCGQYTFAVSSGQLPAGMSLNASGALVGTPTQAGQFEFTVKATDNCGCTATNVYTLTVGCPLRNLINNVLFNTGVDNNGQPLNIPQPDNHYAVTFGINNVVPRAVAAYQGWPLANTAASQWISAFANHFGPSGTYNYRTTFALANCEPGTTIITGRWAADNSGQIFVNNVAVPGSQITNPGFNVWHNFTINADVNNDGTVDLSALNTIEFRVQNVSGPTGVRVEFIRAAARCCECAPPPQGMVAWWPLDEPKGAVVVNDLIGSNHGTPQPGGAIGGVNAPAAVPGAVAGALSFITNNRTVSVPHHPSLNFGTGSFSIDAWFRTGQASPSIEKIIVDKFDPAQQRGYRLSVKGDKLVLTVSDGTHLQTFTSTNALTFGQWQLVAVTVDRSSTPQTVRFHIGSLSVALNSDLPQNLSPALLSLDNTTNLRIGGIETFIDEVELFNRALSSAEIAAIHSAGAAGKCKPCVAPRVTSQPVSHNICPGKPAVLTVAASGSPAPVVQWQVMVGSGPWTNIPNATSTTLVVAPLASQSGNKYRAVFSNACGDAISNAATITILSPGSRACLDFFPGDIFTRTGGRASFSVVLPVGAPVTASSNTDWLTIDSVDTGAAESAFAAAANQVEQRATLYYTLAANESATGRIGTLTIGDQTFTVMQAGANPVVTVSAATFRAQPVASGAIVAAFGTELATTTQAATSLPLPTTLGGTQVKVLDAAGTEHLAPLFFVSPGQVNYQIPPDTVAGPALVTLTAGDGRISTGVVQLNPVAPGLFTADASGRGVPAANALLFRPDGSAVAQPVGSFDPAANRFVPAPLDLGPEDNHLFLVLFGTGISARTDLSAVTARIGGVLAPVTFASAQGDFVGLDQVNVQVPRDLAGRGEVEVELIVDGQTTNLVTINIR